MKTKAAIFLMITLISNFSCEQEVDKLEKQGRISFRINNAVPRTGRVADLLPTALLISLEDAEGKNVYENRQFALVASGQDFETTEEIFLIPGAYSITKFLVLSDDKISFATPREGSEKALLIANALPLVFKVEESKHSRLVPEIVAVQVQDSIQAFGYGNFGVDAVDEPSEDEAWMNVRVKFEPTVGGILYQNVDAEFSIVGYDEMNIEKWRTTLPYIGPQPNDLKIKNGFYRYAIEAKKWGITSKQAFMGAYLWEGRVREGMVPTTYVFTGEAEPKAISHSITYTDNNGTLAPESKITYQYNSQGKVTTISTFVYSKTTQRFVANTETDFEYAGTRVNKIESFLIDSEAPYETITYTYDVEGRPYAITNKSNSSGITTKVNLSYAASDRTITAAYTFSNGQSFDYTFTNEWTNMKSDRTTRGSQLCSEGIYTYDKSINPLKHLGYVDYLLRNYSIGNRLTEQVNYIGCAFPSLVPESYSYTYDTEGYPTTATTYYKGNKLRTQVHYFYR